MLERYFRLKMMESHQYSAIGSWWKRKKGKEANEIDIVGIRAEGKKALVAEVKRQRRNYDHKLFSNCWAYRGEVIFIEEHYFPEFVKLVFLISKHPTHQGPGAIL